MPLYVLNDITIVPTLGASVNFFLVFWMHWLLSSLNNIPVSFNFFPIFSPRGSSSGHCLHMPFNNDCDLWTFSLASGCLCISVHNVWSCQTDLPKSQLGSYQCLAKKSNECPCSTKKHPGSLGDFGSLFFRLLFAWHRKTGAEWSRWGEVLGLPAHLFQPAHLPGPEPWT